ncbi:MAG: carboxypeptidase regulatory-like domain-containing protein [Pedosphaera sp.]|nr:carboxypeptidase regulatory-like domain-containing protein [Pedosphaera sp.]
MKQHPAWTIRRRGKRPLLALLLASLWMLVAPVPGRAAFFPVDLTPPGAAIAPPAPLWPALPQRALTNGGVPFRPGEPVAVTGLDAARRGDFFPTRVAGLAVGRKAARLHVLHGADHSDKDGVPLAELVLLYANGERRAWRLAYGLHARSLTREKGEKKSGLLDPNSDQAGEEGDRGRWFHTAFDNPLPGREIAGVEWVSLFSRATPLLVALTLEQGVPAPLVPMDTTRKVVKRALGSDTSDFRDILVIRAMDSSSGQLLAGATAALTIADDQAPFYFGEVKADADGVLRLPYPPQQTHSYILQVRAPGHVPAQVRGAKTGTGAFAREVQARLEPGVRVGGLVKGTDGKPVSGVKVIAARIEKTSAREYTRTDHEAVFTDAAGQWQCSTLPPEFGKFIFEFYHPEFRAATYTPGASAETNTLATAREDLLAGRTETILLPSIRVLVMAKDEAGQPVAGAEIRVQDHQNGAILPSFRTDAKGRASFMVPEATQLSVAVMARGFAPRMANVMVRPLPATGLTPRNFTPGDLDDSIPPGLDGLPRNLWGGGPVRWPENLVAMTLTKARTFRGRVLDQYQQPVPRARVHLDSWNNTRLVQWQGVADTNGLVTWDMLPEGGLTFTVSAANHAALNASLSGEITEYTFNIQKMSRVIGRVIDADTRKPLPEFSIIRGFAYNPGESTRWERYNPVRGRNGEYSMRLDYSNGNGDRQQILVEAPGYLPQAAQIVTKAGISTNDFVLKRGKGPSGIVEMPDGRPVVGATMALVDVNEYFYMDRPGELRRVNNYGEHVRTDAKGYFEFQPRLDPHTVLASAPVGYAELHATNLLKVGKIVLQPWGRIKGVVRVGQLDPNAVVRLQNPDFQQGDGGRTVAPVWLYLKADPDEAGAYVFDRVPPGERKVHLEFKRNDRKNSRMATSHARQVTVKPGETTEILIGGTGRQVIGQVESSTGNARGVDWRRDQQTLTMVTQAGPSYPVMNFQNAVTEEERQKQMAEHNRRVADYWRSPEGLAIRHAQRSYTLLFETNGTFRVEGVEPGTYSLSMNFTDPAGGENNYSSIGNHYAAVTVPPSTQGKPDAPFDLGTFKVQIRPVFRPKSGFPVPAPVPIPLRDE